MRVAQFLRQQNDQNSGEYDFFLAVLFPHSHLRIYDYNRVVKDLNGMSEQEFLSKVGEVFDISLSKEGIYKPKMKHEFGMYLGGAWYRLVLKESLIDHHDPVKSLDVSILQEYVLDRILGIKDPRTDKRIDFIGGIHGLKVLQDYVDQKGWAVAFSLFPTSIEDLMTVSDSGKIMPPKSTWFEPKLKSGLFVHLI